MDLLETWANWERAAHEPPYLLDKDRSLLRLDAHHCAPFRNWADVYRDEEFGSPKDRRLHLGLLPHPYCGDLRNASILVLLLNPKLGVQNWYAESEVDEYRRAVRRNLRQEFPDGIAPFMFLDPEWGWHGGFSWWNRKLSKVIARIAASREIPFAQARRFLADRLASIEMVPYHSTSLPRNAIITPRKLHSAHLAKAYVHDVLVPRVDQGNAILIVARKAKFWEVSERQGAIVYDGNLARSAPLSPESPGGRAILEFLSIPAG